MMMMMMDNNQLISKIKTFQQAGLPRNLCRWLLEDAKRLRDESETPEDIVLEALDRWFETPNVKTGHLIYLAADVVKERFKEATVQSKRQHQLSWEDQLSAEMNS